MGSSSKRSAKQSARATPAAARTRVRAPIRASGRSSPKPAQKTVAPPHAAPAKTKTRAAPFPLRAVLEQLEPRLLMSADLAPFAADALFAAPASPGGAEFRSLTDADRSSAVITDSVAPIQRTHEVVFVDPRVPDRDQLIAGLAGDAADGRSFEVIVLDPARDGIAQITAALADRIQVDAVHFITHGTDGAVQLGRTWLDAKAVGANAEAIAGWGNALKEDADLLFYGCDLAATARGRALVDWLAELTKADVAASTDATGSARTGGDWELEAKSGSIETEVAVSAEARASWSHALGAVAMGSESGANTTTGNAQDQAAVATAPDGRFVVAWVSDGQDGGGRGVFARLYDAGGAPHPSGEILVNATTANNQEQPAVAMDQNGNFVVVWSGNGMGDGNGVFARRFDAAGTPSGAEFRVNGAVSVGFNQSNPDIAMELNGDFAVVWQSDETGKIEIWLQRYQANGTSIGGASLVSISDSNDDTDPSIAMDDDGDFVVAWQGRDASNNEGIFARRYDSGGVAQGSAAPVNTTTSGKQERPDVAMDTDGDYVVVWDGEGAADSNNTGVYGRRFNAAGTPQGAEFGINTWHPNDQDHAAVGMAADGRFVVSWESKNQDGSNQGIYRQEYTAAGAPDGGEFLVNTFTNNNQTLSAVAMDDNGGYLVAWSGEGPGDSAGVFWRRFATATAGAISGTVYHDVDGDGDLAGATTFAGATVHLFRDLGIGTIDVLDLLQASAVTSPTGTYSFAGLGAGTYYVVVDSRTLGATNTWAEQTYGSAGSALGAAFTTSGGALFGGREHLGPGTSDSVNILNPTTAEHITKVTLSGAGGAGGVDFGFSFNAITTARDGDDDLLSVERTIQGSLRQFIQNANVTAGVQAADFSIGGGGLQSIGVVAALPTITDAVVLDAATQEGVSTTPRIELNGTSAGAVSGLTLAGTGGSTVRGFVINRFNGNGITININSNGNQILANWIGIDAATGAVDRGNNADGIHLRSNGNLVSGNVISGNRENGVLFDGAGATSNVVRGNTMGLNAAGNGLIANGLSGVMLLNGAGGNTIGGTTAGARNVLSGNNQDGITGFASNGNLIQGNYIGTDAGGTLDRGNVEDGIYFENSSNNTVGGAAPGAGNVLSGNGWTGVTFWGTGAGNVVQGNTVGTDPGGTLNLGNGQAGVLIGTNGPATVGGTAPGAGNLIAYSGWDGVLLWSGTGHSVLGNTIRANVEESIDIDDNGSAAFDGVEANDYDSTPTTSPYTHDSDGGVNQHQNFPVLTSAVTTGTQIQIVGTLSSTISTNFRVEFFANAVNDGEAGRYLGFANVATGATGIALINATFAGTLAAGEFVTATATRADGTFTSFFETSELGASVVAANASRSISGMTRHDLNGNGLADDGVAFFTGATVRLYRDDGDGVIGSGDVLQGTATVQLDGTYTFTGLIDATYFVAIDSKTLLFPASEIWAEQTYGVAGAASGGGFLGTPGALFGGRNAAVSDDASTLTTSEHVTRVALSGANATGIDAGFALNAITSSRDGDDDGALSGRTVQGSLRQFIQNSNAIGGTQTANFSVGGGGFRSIALGSALPVITDTVILDATTQEGFGGTPLIELDGSGVATLNDGFQIATSGSTVRGFVINRFLGDGIHLDGSNSIIAGNWIGLDSSGTTALGNASPGVHVLGANNRIGGTGPNDRNVISGNGAEGIRIDGVGATGNLVQGNFIGTDRTGTIDLGNAGAGISLLAGASGNVIGGLTPADRNVVSGNNIDGIWVSGSTANLIQGNYIGTDATGMFAIPNAEDGIWLDGGSGNTVGGTVTAARNVIAGNGWSGVGLSGGGSNHVIQGNWIGLNTSGAALGNLRNGVQISDGTGTQVGGTAAGAGNVIANNGASAPFNWAGVAINSGSSHSVLGNLIYNNSGLGIDVGPAGVTPNDAPDANGVQNFPVLTGAATAGGQITIAGTLNGAAGVFLVEFFASASPGDASGHGEGERYLGSMTVAGNASFVSPAFAAAVLPGERISATATNLATMNTSEFSAHIAATGPNPVLDLDANDSSGATGANYQATFTENGPAVSIADALDALLTDPDSPTLTGLTVTITNVADGAAETLSAAVGGTAIVANYAGGVLQLTGADTIANYQQVLRTVAYHNASDNPNTTARVITFVATDGTNASNAGIATVTVVAANDPPAGASNTVATNEDVAYTFLAGAFGFSDPDFGDSLSVVRIDALSLPVGARLRLAGVDVNSLDIIPVAAITAGNLVFTPALNGNGAGYASFTFSVRDQALAFDPAPKTMTINVAAANDGPMANDVVANGNEDDAQIAIILTAADIDGPVASFRLASLPANGVLYTDASLTSAASVGPNYVAVGNALTLYFVPAADWNGSTVFQFTATDGGGLSDATPATATINIVALNDEPVANSVFASGNEDDPQIAVTLTGSDIEGPVATFRLLGLPAPATGTLYTDAGLTVVAATGIDYVASGNALTLYFVPAANWNGSTGFQFSATDAGGLSDATPASATINVLALNDAPVANNAVAGGNEDDPQIAITLTGSDVEGPVASFRLSSLPANGLLYTDAGLTTLAAAATDYAAAGSALTLYFVPAADWNGSTVFQFTVTDAGGASDATPATATINVAPVNDAPVANDVVANGTEDDAQIAITLTGSDVEGPITTFRITGALPANGTLYTDTLLTTVAIAGVDYAGVGNALTLYFVPAANWNGSTGFQFSATDAGGLSDATPASATINVLALNDAPVANNAVAGGNEDDPQIAITLTGSDVEGPVASFRLSSLPANGLLYTDAGLTTLAAAATDYAAAGSALTLYFVPVADWNGSTVFQFTVTDAGGASDATPATATINVAPVNDAPLAGADAAATNDNTPVATTDVLLNDVLGDQPTAIVAFDALSAQGGTVVPGGGNTFVYTPAAGFSGTDTFTYTIQDADGESSTATVTVTVANVANDPPVNLVPGPQSSAEDTPLIFSTGTGNQISVTDVDANGAPVEVTLNASNGVITLSGIGGLTFITGDGAGDPSMRFTGTLSAINAALNGLVFTPTLDFNGLAFIALSTNDLGASGAGGALVDSDLATINVLPVNDAPEGTDATITLDEDATYTFTLGDFGFNDVDLGDAMTDVRIESLSLPAAATLQLGGVNVISTQVITVADINAGLLVFTPAPNANGAGYASFTFGVRDIGVPPGPVFDLAPNTMTINVAPVNDLPIITSDGGGATAAFVVAENTVAVTTVTASDIDLQPVAFSLAGVDAALFSIDSVTGVLTFNPAPNFEAPGDAGADNVYDVTVRVSDGAGGVDNQALTITVTDANDAPTASDDAYVTDEELPLSIAATGVLGNDGDEDGTPVAAALVAGPANGSVVFNTDGSFVYTPNANFAGVDTFTYQATDGALGSAVATVTITVNPINDAPSATNGNVIVAAAYAFDVPDFNYFDVDGDPLDRIMITALPAEGQLLFDGLPVTVSQEVTAGELAAGRLTYVPPTTSTITAVTFGFSVSDGTLYEAASHTMTVGFAAGAVLPPPPPPPPPPTITPPVTPPVAPPPAPPAAAPDPGTGSPPPSGGGRGGGAGGGEGAAPPPPPPAEAGAPAAEAAQAAAGVVAIAAQSIAGSAPTGSIGFQSGGVAANPGVAAPAQPVETRGEPVGEVKAEMETVAAMAAPEVRQALDEMRERAQEDVKLEARVAGSVFVVSTGLSVGYVLWLLRGGALIASLLSSLPAWRLVDPLPVLGSMGGRAGEEDDDSLEDLVADNRPPSAPAEDAPVDNNNAGSART